MVSSAANVQAREQELLRNLEVHKERAELEATLSKPASSLLSGYGHQLASSCSGCCPGRKPAGS